MEGNKVLILSAVNQIFENGVPGPQKYEKIHEFISLQVRWFFNYVPLYKKPKKVTYVATFDYWLSSDNTSLNLYNINMNLRHEVFQCFVANHIGIVMAGKHQIMTVKRPGRGIFQLIFASTQPG